MDTGEDSRVLSAIQHLINTKGPSVLDRNGNTPLVWAVINNKLNLIRFLVEQCLLPLNVQNFEGETALSISVTSGQYDTVKYLIERGANLNLSNCRCESPLHHAVVIGNLEITRLLVEEGSYVDAEDECGDTPLHFAVREDKTEIVEFLLSIGADANHENFDEETPKQLAEMVGSQFVKDKFKQPSHVGWNGDNGGMKLPLLLQKSAKKAPMVEGSCLGVSGLALSGSNSVWQGENSTSFPKRLTPNSNLPCGNFTGRHLINV